MTDETHEDSQRVPRLAVRSEPGLVILIAAGQPSSGTLPLASGDLEIGRGMECEQLSADDRLSRKHAMVSRRGGRWSVQDLDTKNGTFVDGKRIDAPVVAESPMLIRAGKSLLWAQEDVSAFETETQSVPQLTDGPVLGGLLRRAWGEIAVASRAGDTLFIHGESGSGKELAARAFHEAHYGVGTRAPFVAVNCAAIPEGLAERLLFGAQRGAYSGATADADGYVRAASGGTLFLDEVAELDLLVQAKLLRVLETHEVLPLGASRPQHVDVRICAASHKSLRDEASAGRFREDLYFRIGRPDVRIPPLRERLDEIPFLVARELRSLDAELTPSVTLIEACALRAWPGNVRELLGEIRRAAHRAREEGSSVVHAEHLSAEAGIALVARTRSETRPPEITLASFTDEAILQALDAQRGNVRGAARALGMHRNQLRRWLEKHPDVRAKHASEE